MTEEKQYNLNVHFKTLIERIEQVNKCVAQMISKKTVEFGVISVMREALIRALCEAQYIAGQMAGEPDPNPHLQFRPTVVGTENKTKNEENEENK
jgi:hypothetical protein